MRSLFHPILLAAALLSSGPALAQQAPPLQEQMTPSEFRAAGLDKLDADRAVVLVQDKDTKKLAVQTVPLP